MPTKQKNTTDGEQYRDSWVPVNEGDTLEGVVVDVVRGWSDARTNGGRNMERGWYPLLKVQRDDGDVKLWHAFSAVAENWVLDKQPIPGERIRIEYRGVSTKTPPRGMNAPKLFDCRVYGRDPKVDAQRVYDQLGAHTTAVAPHVEPDVPIDNDPLPF